MGTSMCAMGVETSPEKVPSHPLHTGNKNSSGVNKPRRRESIIQQKDVIRSEIQSDINVLEEKRQRHILKLDSINNMLLPYELSNLPDHLSALAVQRKEQKEIISATESKIHILNEYLAEVDELYEMKGGEGLERDVRDVLKATRHDSEQDDWLVCNSMKYSKLTQITADDNFLSSCRQVQV